MKEISPLKPEHEMQNIQRASRSPRLLRYGKYHVFVFITNLLMKGAPAERKAEGNGAPAAVCVKAMLL